MANPHRALSLSSYKVLFQLDKLSRQSKAHSHLSYLLAGVVLMFIPKHSTGSPSTTWPMLLLATAVGFFALVFGAFMLGEAQPLLYQMGKLSIAQGLGIVSVLFIYWRYLVGANYLKLFGKHHDIIYNPKIFPEVALEQYQSVILEAFNGYENKALIEVKGVVILDRANSIKNFETLEQVTLLDPLAVDIEVRLEELSLLDNGWLNGKGKALDKEKTKLVSEYFYSFYNDSLPLPYLYPTAEGGLQAEWHINDWDISLEIELVSLSAELHVLNLISDEEKELSLKLAEPKDWYALNEMLEGLYQEQA